jgi:predicted transcriptional regulator
MPDKNEKERLKQLQKDLQEKTLMEFEESLPISRELFLDLFDFLYQELEKNGCDDSLKLTKQFLETNQVRNTDEVEKFLKENGGFCDCEVLYNVEEKIED